MSFLRWLGGIIVFIWLIGLFFRFLGGFIHMLIVIAVIVFLYDFFLGKRR
ncbi:MAG: lmo0937 family membrane protein [Clostridiaceae bacterium]|nr:lmo0937 family membrane protein [Clostridiaceae bacterium]